MTSFTNTLALTIAILAGSAAAAQLPPKAGTAPAPAPSGPPAVALPGVSAAGNAALTRIARTPDPIARDAAQKLQALAPQIAATINAPSLDVEKFAAVMRQADGLQNTIRSRTTERLITGLKALPPADRAPFLKAVSTSQQQRAPGR